MNLRINKRIILVIIIFVIFIISYNLGLLGPLEKIFSIFIDQSTVQLIKLSTNTNQLLDTTTASKKNLISEIERLKKNLGQASLKILELQAAEKENQQLRSILNFREKHSYTFLTGELIHKVNLELERSVIINKGSKNGVEKGNAVIINDGILIGRVDNVTLYKSTVQLTIDNGSQILATLANSDHNIAGVIIGRRKNSLSLDLIPKNISILPGQQIITNGLQEFIPPNLYIGETLELQESPNEIFNSAIVSVPYSIENLTVATIIIQN